MHGSLVSVKTPLRNREDDLRNTLYGQIHLFYENYSQEPVSLNELVREQKSYKLRCQIVDKYKDVAQNITNFKVRIVFYQRNFLIHGFNQIQISLFTIQDQNNLRNQRRELRLDAQSRATGNEVRA